MKSILSILIPLLIPQTLLGQSSNGLTDTTETLTDGKHRVITNQFKSNWFIGAGAGPQIFFGDHNKQMSFGDRLTPGLELYIGKWFTPGIGIRVAANGFQNKGLTQNGSHSTGELYDARQRLYVQEFDYLNTHGDVMFNLNNMISGYKKDRFYAISPYIGLGWMFIFDTDNSGEISANLGVFNSFRLSDAFDLTLDVRGSLVHDRFDGEVGHRREEGMLTAAVGFVYKFKKRGWEAERTKIVHQSDETEIRSLREGLSKMTVENERLRKQLAESNARSVTDVVSEDNVLIAPILITFQMNKSKVSNEARVNLGFFAELIKKGGSEVKYEITGYADRGTGSSETNERLSKERAEAIFDVLVNEFNVPANQLTIDHKGGVENMYYDDPRLSRAVITKIK